MGFQLPVGLCPLLLSVSTWPLLLCMLLLCSRLTWTSLGHPVPLLDGAVNLPLWAVIAARIQGGREISYKISYFKAVISVIWDTTVVVVQERDNKADGTGSEEGALVKPNVGLRRGRS